MKTPPKTTALLRWIRPALCGPPSALISGAAELLLDHAAGELTPSQRDLVDTMKAGDAASRLAFDVYVHRLRHYLGAYLAQLGGVDAIVFTAGVGENSPDVRAGALAGLVGLGIHLDAARNASRSPEPRRISTDDSPVAVLVVPTNEELEIARQSLAALGG